MPSNNTAVSDENLCSELLLQPGEHMQLTLQFRPEALTDPAIATAEPPTATPTDTPDMPKAGHLLEKTFHCCIRANTRTSDAPIMRTITCKARVCQSFIRLSTTELAFGDVTRGSKNTLPLTVKNMSHLPAMISTQLLSKIIQVSPRNFTIPPLQTREVAVQLAPDSLDPDLRKLITFSNTKNRANDQALVVSANIIDPGGVALHSNLYSVITPTQDKAIDFGSVPLNSRSLSMVTLKNNTNSTLSLRLTNTRPDVVVHVPGQGVDASSSTGTTLKHEYFVQMVQEQLESTQRTRRSSSNRDTRTANLQLPNGRPGSPGTANNSPRPSTPTRSSRGGISTQLQQRLEALATKQPPTNNASPPVSSASTAAGSGAAASPQLIRAHRSVSPRIDARSASSHINSPPVISAEMLPAYLDLHVAGNASVRRQASSLLDSSQRADPLSSNLAHLRSTSTSSLVFFL